jgi:hypothetical protein
MTEKSHAGFGREPLAAGKYLQTDHITIEFDHLGPGDFTIDIFDDGQITERSTLRSYSDRIANNLQNSRVTG